jgi:hypothetical protein
LLSEIYVESDISYPFDIRKAKNKKNVSCTCSFPISTRYLQNVSLHKEAKYVDSWPNTTSAWAGWSRFDIPEDRYSGVHSLLQCTGVSYLPLG